MGDKAHAYEVGLENAEWFKAKASGDDGAGCVEVAFVDGYVALRDSVYPDRAAHVYTRHEWECFLHGARRGEFDIPSA